jgi:hypothetical protein
VRLPACSCFCSTAAWPLAGGHAALGRRPAAGAQAAALQAVRASGCSRGDTTPVRMALRGNMHHLGGRRQQAASAARANSLCGSRTEPQQSPAIIQPHRGLRDQTQPSPLRARWCSAGHQERADAAADPDLQAAQRRRGCKGALACTPPAFQAWALPSPELGALKVGGQSWRWARSSRGWSSPCDLTAFASLCCRRSCTRM